LQVLVTSGVDRHQCASVNNLPAPVCAVPLSSNAASLTRQRGPWAWGGFAAQQGCCGQEIFPHIGETNMDKNITRAVVLMGALGAAAAAHAQNTNGEGYLNYSLSVADKKCFFRVAGCKSGRVTRLKTIR